MANGSNGKESPSWKRQGGRQQSAIKSQDAHCKDLEKWNQSAEWVDWEERNIIILNNHYHWLGMVGDQGAFAYAAFFWLSRQIGQTPEKHMPKGTAYSCSYSLLSVPAWIWIESKAIPHRHPFSSVDTRARSWSKRLVSGLGAPYHGHYPESLLGNSNANQHIHAFQEDSILFISLWSDCILSIKWSSSLWSLWSNTACPSTKGPSGSLQFKKFLSRSHNAHN